MVCPGKKEILPLGIYVIAYVIFEKIPVMSWLLLIICTMPCFKYLIPKKSDNVGPTPNLIIMKWRRNEPMTMKLHFLWTNHCTMCPNLAMHVTKIWLLSENHNNFWDRNVDENRGHILSRYMVEINTIPWSGSWKITYFNNILPRIKTMLSIASWC